MLHEPEFSSFFWAGYECAYSLIKKRGNRQPKRLDLLAATRHDEYCRMDYTLIRELGITTVREGLAWNQIDTGVKAYDFSRFEKLMVIGREEGIEQVWNLNHFDFPPDVDPFSEHFSKRFAEYAKRAVDVIRKHQKGTIYINLINEISFFSWIGAEVGVWAPFSKGRGLEFKKQLVKAAIASMEAMKSVDHEIRFIHIDPIMYRKAKSSKNKSQVAFADNFNNNVRFQTFDMLSGRLFPELGGKSEYLDLIGINYYFHNQEWILNVSKTNPNVAKSEVIPFGSKDRLGIDELLTIIYGRYGRPMVLTETGSYGSLRSRWWSRLLKEIDRGKEVGLPLHGVCVYPTVDRPDWHNPKKLTNSGLWDFKDNDPELVRIPHKKSISLIKNYINRDRIALD